MLSGAIIALLALGSTINAAATTSPYNNPFAGTWNLTRLTISFPNGTITQPKGTHPYGRLILTPDFFFISQFNSGDYLLHPFEPFPKLYVAGTNADNAAVVRGSLGLSGTYRVDQQGTYLGLSTTGSTIPNFIDSSVVPPNSTFTLGKGSQIMIETLTSRGDGSVTAYNWSRIETFHVPRWRIFPGSGAQSVWKWCSLYSD